MAGTRTHAALLASPGMGHLIPVLELGKRLATHHSFDVTIIIVSTDASPAESQLLKTAMNSNLFKIVLLPPVDITGLVDPGAAVVTVLAVMMRQCIPVLRSTISAFELLPSVLMVDLFGTEALAIGDEFGMRKYVFITSNAWFLAKTIYAPTLDQIPVAGEKMEIPGCNPVKSEDFVDAYDDLEDQSYVEYTRIGVEIPLVADGILVNTWEDLEPTTLAALREDQFLKKVARVPVYPIGPLARPVEQSVLRSEILDWLDMQPAESVIYVSFGSGGTLSTKQTIEFAWGLELSQQRFIWVLRPPMDNTAFGAFFNGRSKQDGPSAYLPDGFLSRTEKVGLVVPMWAPQASILAHPAVGGFLSHCGWNSTLESIVNGVPMITWPLYAEQKMNGAMLAEEIGVAVRPEVWASNNQVLGRVEIESMVRMIMGEKKGSQIRGRIMQLKYSAERALDKGGSSHNSLAQVAKDCETSMKCHVSRVQSGNGA